MSNKQNDIWNENLEEIKQGAFVKKDKKYKCPFCGRERDVPPSVICPCEVKNTGMDEFWKD